MSEPLSDDAIHRLIGAAAEPANPAVAAPLRERYRILRELGRGGMGVVFEAEDLALGRRVALKVLGESGATGPIGAHLKERLLREARAAARLSHANIATVYDAADGVIAMELVNGAPLSSIGNDDVRRLVRLVKDAARAVHHAHEHGIVHRDLKPHNLLVAGERVVVTDFGLAKEIGGDSTLSRSGQVIGTPAFMAPEQAAGRHHEVDARSDVYGLGATLFDVIAGRPPFVETELGRLLRKIAEDDPPALHRVRPGVPKDLARIVSTCLEKDRSRRYPTARALADDLDRWLAGVPVLAADPTPLDRAVKFARRHRAGVAVTALVLVALLGAALFSWNERVERGAADAALALSATVDRARRDAAMHQRLGEDDLARACRDAAAERCRKFLERHDTAHAWYLLGALEQERGRRDEALDALDQAIARDPGLLAARHERGLLASAALFERLAAESRLGAVADAGALGADLAGLRARALDDLAAGAAADLGPLELAVLAAEQARLAGEFASARNSFEEALRLDPLDTRSRFALAQVEIALGNGDAAWHMAMSAFDLHRGFGPAYTAGSLAHAAGLTDAPAATDPSGIVERALRQHELEGAEQRIRSGDASPAALLERGGARLKLADVEGALADFSAALAQDPGQAAAYGSRALVHARKASVLAGAGRRDEALTAYESAIADCSAALTIEPALAGAVNNRGVCRAEQERILFDLGRADDARAARAAARADFDSAIAAEPRFALALQNRAMLARRAAEEAADPELARTIAAARADLARVTELKPNDADAWVESALLLEIEARAAAVAGDATRSGELGRKALAAFDRAVAAAPTDPRPVGLRGICHARQGQADLAAADLAHALSLAPDARARARFSAELERLRAP